MDEEFLDTVQKMKEDIRSLAARVARIEARDYHEVRAVGTYQKKKLGEPWTY